MWSMSGGLNGYGTTPPSPGTASNTGTTGYLNQLSSQTGVPLGSTGPQMPAGQTFFPYIYAGNAGYRAGRNTSANAAEYGAAHNEKYKTVLEAQDSFMNSGAKNVRHWALLLALAGYADGNGVSAGVTAQQAVDFAQMAPLSTVAALHLNFLKDSANLYGLGKKITPEQYLKQQLDYRLGDKWDGDLSSLTPQGVIKLSANQGTTTHTQTQRSVDYMSPEDARGMVRGMLQQELGRDPTQAEYEDFLATVTAAERQNPSLSRTTYTTDASGNTTNSSTVSHGGLTQSGASQAIYEKLKDQPSWGEWQAVGTYAPALFAALDAPVSGV